MCFPAYRWARLTGFLVGGVRLAEAAVLLQFDPLTRVRLVLGGDVVPALARLACERDGRSLVAGHGRWVLVILGCGLV